MKIRLATLTCLLIAKGAVAQTLVNPSFEVPDVYLAGAGVAGCRSRGFADDDCRTGGRSAPR